MTSPPPGACADYLRAIAGQPTDLAALAPVVGVRREPSAGPTTSVGAATAPSPVTGEPDPAADAAPVGAEAPAEAAAQCQPDDTAADDGAVTPLGDQPTQAGMPIFEDDGEVGWIARRTVPPAPRRLPRRPGGQAALRPGATTRHPGPPAAGGAHRWDRHLDQHRWWSLDGDGPEHGDRLPGVLALGHDRVRHGERRLQPRRRALHGPGAALVSPRRAGRGRGARAPHRHGPAEPEPRADTAGERALVVPVLLTRPGRAAPLTGLTATDFDPQGSPPEENADLAPTAVDGDPATSWHTETYRQQLGPGGLKTGVGLVVDLGSSRRVASVDVTFVGRPTGFSLYLTDKPPTGVADLTPVADGTADGTSASSPCPTSAAGRYLIVWLTALPPVHGGFRGEVAEVVVRG